MKNRERLFVAMILALSGFGVAINIQVLGGISYGELTNVTTFVAFVLSGMALVMCVACFVAAIAVGIRNELSYRR